MDINSDLIISIGFQGAAIKAAFAFNKPILFSALTKIILTKLTLKDVLINKKLKTILKANGKKSEIKLILSLEIIRIYT